MLSTIGSSQDVQQGFPRVQVVVLERIVGSAEGTDLAEAAPVAGAGHAWALAFPADSSADPVAWALTFPAGSSADPAAWVFLATAIAWEADFADQVLPGEDKER